MRVVLTEESHNHIDWEIKSAVVWSVVGILLGAVAVSLLVLSSQSPMRWLVVGVTAGLALVLCAVFALTTPLTEHGHLERLPDGGDIKRTRVWMIVGSRISLDIDLADLAGIEIEEEVFEDVPPASYRQARLWVLTSDGARHCLTPWVGPESIDALAPALSRAARLDSLS